jgi:hypothetical protein
MERKSEGYEYTKELERAGKQDFNGGEADETVRRS